MHERCRFVLKVRSIKEYIILYYIFFGSEPDSGLDAFLSKNKRFYNRQPS